MRLGSKYGNRGAAMSPLTISEIPWQWAIPEQLISWTLEDVENSKTHHYGV